MIGLWNDLASAGVSEPGGALDFRKSANPIKTRGAQIMHATLLLAPPPSLFRPSNDLVSVKGHSLELNIQKIYPTIKRPKS